MTPQHALLINTHPCSSSAWCQSQ